MKKFMFIYQPISGGSASVKISAPNQGVAISRFKSQFKALKIIKIKKEKKQNGKEK